jgi:alcohol dehydrogenase class IV
MGAVAFQKDLGATHSLAHPLSAICGMHHGTANAVCLPSVMRFNAQRKPGLYRRIGGAANLDVMRASDADADRLTVEFIQKFITDLGFGAGLASFSVKEAQLDALADEAFADACHQTNPVPVTRDDLKALYRAAL